jgi:hypothetical protein
MNIKTKETLINIGSGYEKTISDYAKLIANYFKVKINFKFDTSSWGCQYGCDVNILGER